MLRSDQFKDIVLGDGGTNGTNDVAAYTGRLSDYKVERIFLNNAEVSVAYVITDLRGANAFVDANGNPLGLPVPLLTGFLTGKGTTHGRPTWVAWAKDGALLVSDDTAGIVWRVIAPGAAPNPPIKPVVTGHMPPQRSLNSDPNAQYKAKLGEDSTVKAQ